MDQARRLRGSRPAGPPPRPSTEPVRVQRRASNTGMIMVCGQKVSLGRAYRHETLTIWVSVTTLAIELDDDKTRVVRRTTSLPVRNVKAERHWATAAITEHESRLRVRPSMSQPISPLAKALHSCSRAGLVSSICRPRTAQSRSDSSLWSCSTSNGDASSERASLADELEQPAPQPAVRGPHAPRRTPPPAHQRVRWHAATAAGIHSPEPAVPAAHQPHHLLEPLHHATRLSAAAEPARPTIEPDRPRTVPSLSLARRQQSAGTQSSCIRWHTTSWLGQRGTRALGS